MQTNEYRYPATRFVDDRDLGVATQDQLRRMCELMQGRGWDVRYGGGPNRPALDSEGRELEFPIEAYEADWNEALAELSKDFAPLNAELKALRDSLHPLTRAAVQLMIEALYEHGGNAEWSAAAALVSVSRWHVDDALDSDLIDAYIAWPGEPVEVLAARIVLQEYERKQIAAQPAAR